MAASGVAFASPAQAFEKTASLACAFPYLAQAQPATVVANGTYDPPEPTVGQPFSLRATTALSFSGGLNASLIGGTSLEVGSTTLTVSSGPNRTLTNPAARDVNTGQYRSTFVIPQSPGTGHEPYSTSLERIGFTIIARDADGKVIELDESATAVPQDDGNPDTTQIGCELAPAAQDTLLARTFFGDSTPPPPTPKPTPIAPPTPTPDPFPAPTVTVSDVTQTSAKLCWSGSLGQFDGLEQGVYISSLDDSFRAATDPFFVRGADGCATVTGRQPGVGYGYYVVARKADGEVAKISTNGRLAMAFPDASTAAAPPLGASSITSSSAIVCWNVTAPLHASWMVLNRRQSGGLIPASVKALTWYAAADGDGRRLCATLSTQFNSSYDISLGYPTGFETYALENVETNPVKFTAGPIEHSPFPTPTPTPSPTPWVDPTPVVDPTPTPTPTPIAPPTPSPTPQPTCSPIALRYQYAVSGSVSVKTLTKGSVPLSGETTLSSFCGAPGGLPLSGPISFAPATGNLTALGFLPVSAKVALVATEPLAGSLTVGAPGTSGLTLSTKVRIKLPSVKVLGIELAGGANCQAKQISALTLKNTQPSFTMANGGPVAGTLAISDLSGCGFLTGIVSPLTSGAGNLIALNLTPRTS